MKIRPNRKVGERETNIKHIVKECAQCELTKPHYASRATICVTCTNDEMKKARASKPPRKNKPYAERAPQVSRYRAEKRWSDPTFRENEISANRRAKLKRAYGITLEDFEALAKDQNNLCAICFKPETNTRFGRLRELSVDHDHVTGKIRALLCTKCNSIIGMANDDLWTILRAMTYLLDHGKKFG